MRKFDHHDLALEAALGIAIGIIVSQYTAWVWAACAGAVLCILLNLTNPHHRSSRE
jgi:hypothetical protein